MNVYHHHHVHFMRYFLACIPLDKAVHILGFIDVIMIAISLLFSLQSSQKGKLEQILESESLSGIKFSYIYYAFEYGFLFMIVFCYLPRSIFYMLFLTRKRKIRALMWYVNVKNGTFFCLCLLSVITLILTFGFSTLLSNTLGTGVAYMIILFMVPMDIVLVVDLYLCITCKYYLEERVWRA